MEPSCLHERACLSSSAPHDFWDDMADYPVCTASKAEIARAGRALKDGLPWHDGASDAGAAVFRVAYDWRDAHLYPMRRMRAEMAKIAREHSVSAICAARLKRMASIRKKLSETSLRLNQIQDLGGCRIIVPDMQSLGLIVASYESGRSRHTITRRNDYIAFPKSGGYRSHHMILDFVANENQAAFHGKRIEIQVRTRLQHAWATAVEAVGLFRGEDLKGGKGCPDWLELFALMSDEMAFHEQCPVRPSAPDRATRRAKLSALDQRLGALSKLQGYRKAVRVLEDEGTGSAGFLVVSFDRDTMTTRSRRIAHFSNDARRWEALDFASPGKDTVIVEIDRVHSLRDAYPNYYLDVSAFTSHLFGAIRPYGPMFIRGWTRASDSGDTP